MTLAPGAAWSVGTTSVGATSVDDMDDMNDMDDMKVDAKRNAKLDAMQD